MEKGNAKSAIYWAEHLMRFRSDDYHAYLRRGWAYELNQEYEKALHDYNHALSLLDRDNIVQSQYPTSTLNIRFDRYRVYYKFGRKDDAFKGYCSYADDVLLKNSRLKSKTWNDRKLVLGSMHDRIIMNRSTEYMRLTAFVDYQDFLNFMEEEHAKLGSSPEYEEAMQLFRAIKNEIIEENLPRSKASDELDALRNKIREERKQQ
jgi:tetratricopeptide (TPR) repeat protein